MQFSFIRLILLVIVGLFSLIVLGLAGHLDYGLGIATAVLTFVAVVPVLVIDLFRKGVFTSWTAVELAWVGLLWILWLSTGSVAANDISFLFCGTYTDFYGTIFSDAAFCSELRAIAAFAFINFFLLLALFIWVLMIGVRAHNAGNTGIWQQSPAEYQHGMNAGGPMGGATPMANRPMATV